MNIAPQKILSQGNSERIRKYSQRSQAQSLKKEAGYLLWGYPAWLLQPSATSVCLLFIVSKEHIAEQDVDADQYETSYDNANHRSCQAHCYKHWSTEQNSDRRYHHRHRDNDEQPYYRESPYA